MKKKDFITLTLDLYDLTSYFPNKEPLRYKIRDIADNILSDLLLLVAEGPSLEEKKNIKNGLINSIKVMENLFEVAKPQDWVSPDDIEEMKEEYSRIKQAVESVETSEEKTKSEPKPQPEPKTVPKEVNESTEVVEDQDLEMESISDRQQRVVKEIEKKGPSQISDLKEEFNEVSRRTLIRDLNELTDKGLINKTGKGPAVFYSLNK
ncbi:MAG: DeoR family transcriptional regulator [Candidatus Paceibacterota bacterium]